MNAERAKIKLIKEVNQVMIAWNLGYRDAIPTADMAFYIGQAVGSLWKHKAPYILIMKPNHKYYFPVRDEDFA